MTKNSPKSVIDNKSLIQETQKLPNRINIKNLNLDKSCLSCRKSKTPKKSKGREKTFSSNKTTPPQQQQQQMRELITNKFHIFFYKKYFKNILQGEGKLYGSEI